MSTPESENRGLEAESSKEFAQEAAPKNFAEDVDAMRHKLREIANAERMAADSPAEQADQLKKASSEQLQEAQNMGRLLGKEAVAKGFGVGFEVSAKIDRKAALKDATEKGFPQMAKYMEDITNPNARKMAEMEMRVKGYEQIARVPNEDGEADTEYWFKRGK